MTYVIEANKDYSIYCLEQGCWNVHGMGQGRHRCDACRVKRQQKNKLHSMYHGGVRTRCCSQCRRRLPIDCYHRDELIRKRPICRDCRENMSADVRMTEFSHPSEPSGYAVAAPGKVWWG